VNLSGCSLDLAGFLPKNVDSEILSSFVGKLILKRDIFCLYLKWLEVDPIPSAQFVARVQDIRLFSPKSMHHLTTMHHINIIYLEFLIVTSWTTIKRWCHQAKWAEWRQRHLKSTSKYQQTKL
jgi:hypothetical protein